MNLFKRKLLSFSLVLTTLVLYSSTAICNDEFTDLLNTLQTEAHVQARYFHTMGVVNYAIYESTQSELIWPVDHVLYSHQSELFWSAIGSEIEEIRRLYNSLGKNIFRIKAVETTLLNLLMQVDSVVHDSSYNISRLLLQSEQKPVSTAQFQNYGSKISLEDFENTSIRESLLKMVSSLPTDNASTDLGQFYSEYIGLLKFTESIEKFISLHFNFSKKDLEKFKQYGLFSNWITGSSNAVIRSRYIVRESGPYPKGLLIWSLKLPHPVVIQFKSLLLKQVQENLEPLWGLVTSVCKTKGISPQSTVFLGKLENEIKVPKVIEAGNESNIVVSNSDVESKKPEVLPRLNPDVLGVIKYFKSRLTAEAQLELTRKNLTNTDQKIIKMALGNDPLNSEYFTSIQFSDVRDLIFRLGGGSLETTFGERYFIPQLNVSTNTLYNSEIIWFKLEERVKNSQEYLAATVKGVLGTTLRESHWSIHLVEEVKEVKTETQIQAEKILKMIDLNSFIPLQYSNNAIASKAVSQELFVKALGHFPFYFNDTKYCPSSYRVENKNGICAHFPADSVPARSSKRFESVEAFLSHVNALLKEIGKNDFYFRLPTPDEYTWAAQLTSNEKSQYSEFQTFRGISKFDPQNIKVQLVSGEHQSHAIDAKKPNSKGFYSSGLREWTAYDSITGPFFICGRSFLSWKAPECQITPELGRFDIEEKDIGFRLVLVKVKPSGLEH